MPQLPPSHSLAKTKQHKSTTDRWGRGRGGSRWDRKRERIFQRDRYQCQECKRRGKETYVDLHGKYHGVCDHIVPTSRGGDDSESNLQTLCQDCDKQKTHKESRGGVSSSYSKKE